MASSSWRHRADGSQSKAFDWQTTQSQRTVRMKERKGIATFSRNRIPLKAENPKQIGSGRLQSIINTKEQLYETILQTDYNAELNSDDRARAPKLSEWQDKSSDFLMYKFADGTLTIANILDAKSNEASELVCGLKIIAKALSFEDRCLRNNLVENILSSKGQFILVITILTGKMLTKTPFNNDDFLPALFDLFQHLIDSRPIAALEVFQIIFPSIDNLLQNVPDLPNKQGIIQGFLELKEQDVTFQNTFAEKFKDGENHNKFDTLPPFNYMLMENIPKEDEILDNARPFLRPLITNGIYHSAEQYLDIHFRLLREDLFHNFRKCISEYFFGEVETGILYSNAHLESIGCGFNSLLWQFSVPFRECVNWETSKKLSPGNLICLSSTGFTTFCFASIQKRLPTKSSCKGCLLLLELEGNQEITFNINDSYDIIDTMTFFESYRHICNRLKQLHEAKFPLKRCLLQFQDCDTLPSYLSCNQGLSHAEISKFAAEIADDQQFAAFEMALTNKMSLIQGPPGTGKSYLGFQLVKFLLNDKAVKKPLVIMCYTNHALDQFLAKIVTITNKVVRIGGQSKTEMLQQYNLHNIRKWMKIIYRFEWKKAKKMKKEYGTLLSGLDIQLVLLGMSSLADSLGMQELLDDDLLEELVPVIHEECVSAELHSAYETYYGSCRQWIGQFNTIQRELWTERNDIQDMISGITDPITQCLKGNSILNCNFKRQLLGFNKKQTLNDAILWQWLCLDSAYTPAYANIDHFQQTLQLLVFQYMELQPIFTTKQNVQTTESAETLAITEDISNILQHLCNYKNACATWNTEFHCKIPLDKETYDEKLRDYICRIPQHDFFKLFSRSAFICCEKNNVKIPEKCSSIWQMDILQRWKYFLGMGESAKILPHEIRNLDPNSFCFSEIDNEFNTSILRKADVIGLTTTGAAKHADLLAKLNPTTVIVEEAAEVLESHIVTALSAKTNHLIMIGDHMQLKPSCNVYNLEEKYNMNLSLFERLFINGAPSTTLMMQHRMRPCIAELLVPEFYTQLQNHTDVQNYENVKGVSSNLFFLQHTVPELTEHEMKSYSNPHEAQFLIRLSEYLIYQGNNASDITILTTYVGQLRLIKRLRPSSGVIVTTVDNYQGEENGIILLSFVRSNNEEKVGFIKTKNRLCVALSRAKQGLFCIGNFEMFARISPTWKQLVAKLKGMNSFGASFPLQCYNHPERKWHAKTATDLIQNQHRCPSCSAKENNARTPDIQMKEDTRDNINGYMEFKSDFSLAPVREKPMEQLIKEKIIGATADVVQEMAKLKIREQNEYKKCKHDFKVSPNVNIEEFQSVSQEENSPNIPSQLLLSCGHIISRSIYFEGYKCSEQIEKELPCHHKQKIKCGSRYDKLKCDSEVPKILSCGHKVYCCFMSDGKCPEMVNITLPYCGHEITIPCAKKGMTVMCSKPCGVKLACGHVCSGTCHDCRIGLCHTKCRVMLERTLDCGHHVREQCCHKEIQCKQRCTFKCIHGQCFNPCYAPCFLCSEPCPWNCEHQRCSRACGEPCDRQPCMEPCIKRFNCGHLCPCFCGELCPPFCPQCCGDAAMSNAVYLEDCKHLISEKELSSYLSENKNIFPHCPNCKTPITYNKRFEPHMKSYKEYKSRHAQY